MSESLLILHVLDHSLPLHSGYAFRSQAIIEGQRKLGWNTAQVTSSKHESTMWPEETVSGITFQRTRAPGRVIRSVPLINQYAVVARSVDRLQEICKRQRPDIIHAHSPCLMGLAALRAGRSLNIPVVYEMRASWEDAAVHHGTSKEGSARYRLSRYLESFVLRKVDAVTTICDGLKSEIVSRGVQASRIEVIPNAVDTTKFVPGVPDPNLVSSLQLSGKNVLGFAGSFYRYEGLELALRALESVLVRHPKTHLLLMGGGPEEDRLKRLAQELGLQESITFAGRIGHSEIGAYLNLVDVFVFPRVSSKLTEMVTPLKPLEAMAQRRIVLASNVGGHQELISDGETGVLFEAGNCEALSNAIISLLDEPGSWGRLHDAAQHFVRSQRSWERSVARYAPVYENLISDVPVS